MSKSYEPEIVTATLLDGMINEINNAWHSVSCEKDTSLMEYMTHMRHLTNDDSLPRPTVANPTLHLLGLHLTNRFTDIADYLGEPYPNQTLIRKAFKKSNVGVKTPYFSLN